MRPDEHLPANQPTPQPADWPGLCFNGHLIWPVEAQSWPIRRLQGRQSQSHREDLHLVAVSSYNTASWCSQAVVRMAFEGLGAIIPHHSRKSTRLLQAQAMVAHASDDLVNHYAKSVAAMLSGKRTNFCIVQRCWDSTPATLELGQYEATRVDGGSLRLSGAPQIGHPIGRERRENKDREREREHRQRGRERTRKLAHQPIRRTFCERHPSIGHRIWTPKLGL